MRLELIGQLRFICHSGAKEKWSERLWLGAAKGRKAIHMAMEKQMFGK